MSSAKPYESRPGWAVLYPAKNKTDWQGDQIGVIAIDGKRYWIVAWEKVDSDGERYLLVNLKPKEDSK